MVLAAGCVLSVILLAHEHPGLVIDVLGTVTVVWPHERVRRGEGSELSTSTRPVEMTPSRFSEAAQSWLGPSGWTVHECPSY